jgi:hypothetical protein
VFRLPIDANGHLGAATLEPERWYGLTLQWDLSRRECAVLVDGREAARLPVAHQTLNGLSYVRFVSTASERDPSGFLVERVAVDIAEPFAPACTPEALRQHEERYVRNLVPRWSKPR